METPSSTRRVTRSQTLASANKNNNNIPISKKYEESEKGVTKSMKRNGKQQPLLDITNDSPIVGLAMESLDETPSAAAAAMSKNRVNGKIKYCTPGSGEALLRGQVKNLLQKVEEEAVFSKLSLEKNPFLHQLRGASPMAIVAPTPANTPQLFNLSANGTSQINSLACVTASPVEDKFVVSQMVTVEGHESEKDYVTRSLLLDFSEKIGEESEESKEKISSADDDDASIWSIQVNASSTKDNEDEEEDEEGVEEVEEECDYYEEEEEEYDDDNGVDELCQGIRKMTMAKFAGKHMRFVYNSDGELEGEEECSPESSLLMGGKQLCFHEE